jgi:integrase
MSIRKVAPTPGLRKGSKPGEWRLEICIPGTRGRDRRRRTIFAESRAEALAAWADFHREVIARGGRARAWTLRTYLDTFGKYISGRYLSRGARDFTYRAGVLVARIGDVRLDKINAAVVRDLASALAKQYAPVTVNLLVATLRRILRDAVDRQELRDFPIRGRLPLQRVEQLRLEMTDEERGRFLRAFDDEAAFRRDLAGRRVARISDAVQTGFARPDGAAAGVEFAFLRALKPIFVVALETGLSRADLLSLTWADVAGPVIRRPRQKTRVDCEIPISAACREALEELRSRPLRHSSRVFVSPGTGRPVCDHSLRRAFATAKRLAGITRRLRFHDLRHTFASRLASAGVSLQVIARALGHTSIAMSQRYARPSEEAMTAVRNALDANSAANNARRTNGGK